MVKLLDKVELDVCTYVDQQENNLTVEIVLPFVSQKNIKLKVNSRCLLLYVASGNSNFAKYIPFHYPVEAKKAKAIYEHGLLRVVIPLRE